MRVAPDIAVRSLVRRPFRCRLATALPLSAALLSGTALLYGLATLALPPPRSPDRAEAARGAAVSGVLQIPPSQEASSVEARLEPSAGPASGAPGTNREDRSAGGSGAAAAPGDAPAPVDAGSRDAEPSTAADRAPDDDTLADIVEAVRAEKEKLAASRAELDLREKSVRELIRVAEQRLARMEELAARLEDLVGQLGQEEEARLQSLVSLYQSMKPKQAAEIFDRLELPVLLRVVRRMRESKLAPIVAAMDPERARELTRALSQPADLPQSD
jgi:flagellar motility protein MotE (MotC chaperone)